EILTALKGGPSGLGFAMNLASPTGLFGAHKLAQEYHHERDYGRLTAKNVFAGLAPPSAARSATGPDKGVLKFVQLTSITANYIAEEATLRNRMTNKYTRLRAEGGFNTFEVRDGTDQVVLKGKVLAITPREVV